VLAAHTACQPLTGYGQFKMQHRPVCAEVERYPLAIHFAVLNRELLLLVGSGRARQLVPALLQD